MCSVAAMPAELLVGHSPPPAYRGHHFLYSNPLLAAAAVVSSSSTTPSTPIVTVSTSSATVKQILRSCLTSSGSPLTTTTTTTSTAEDKNSSLLRKSHSSGSLSNNMTNIKNITNNSTATTNTTSYTNNHSNKQKKKVVFADDRGRPLTQVRVMSEPSILHRIPLWIQNSSYLANAESPTQNAQPTNTWSLRFLQPASDYLTFRRKLEQNSVCLENVTINKKDECLTGTVKVKNLAYDKQVIVRASTDNWITHEDIHCTYVEVRQSMPTNAINSALYQQRHPIINNLYDTFRFQIFLPIKSDNIEFCVCYRVNDAEYWDNNDGKNYTVTKQQQYKENVSYTSTATIIRMHQASATDILLPSSEIGDTNTSDISNEFDNEKAQSKSAQMAKFGNVRSWSSDFIYWQHTPLVDNEVVPYW